MNSGNTFLRISILSSLILTLCLMVSSAISSTCYASQEVSITVGGTAREYFVYQPKSYTTGQKVPVVFVLHPLTKDAAWAEKTMAWDKCADKNGFLVVYGQSAAANHVWNAELTAGERAYGFDDIGYLKAVINNVETNYSVLTTKVFMVGFSSGAIMAGKMGVTIPNSLTAVATVEGFTGFPGQDVNVPTDPISAIMFRGTSDDVVPYTDDQTSSLFHFPVCSAVQTATDWAQADGFSSTPTTSQMNGGNLDISDYTGGKRNSQVELVTVNGGKHVYDSGDTDIIWAFFSGLSKHTQAPV